MSVSVNKSTPGVAITVEVLLRCIKSFMFSLILGRTISGSSWEKEARVTRSKKVRDSVVTEILYCTLVTLCRESLWFKYCVRVAVLQMEGYHKWNFTGWRESLPSEFIET